MDINFFYRLQSITIINYFVAKIPDLAIGSSFKLSTSLKVNTFYYNWLKPLSLFTANSSLLYSPYDRWCCNAHGHFGYLAKEKCSWGHI